MTQPTLDAWLQGEIKKRDMSVREFSRASGIGHTTLNQILNPSADSDHHPSVDVLIRLARFTGTDICSLIAMIAPEDTMIDAEASVLAQRIKALSKTKREFIEGYILGLFLKPVEDDRQN